MVWVWCVSGIKLKKVWAASAILCLMAPEMFGLRNALQLAHQMGTPIEPPILEMLKKWLGEEAFYAAIGQQPPAAKQPPAATPAAQAQSAGPSAPRVNQPPLVLIREGVAAQNKEAVRSALRMAVEQDTQIDAPVLEMLRKWLGEDDEALQTLAKRRGIHLGPERSDLDDWMCCCFLILLHPCWKHELACFVGMHKCGDSYQNHYLFATPLPWVC